MAMYVGCRRRKSACDSLDWCPVLFVVQVFALDVATFVCFVLLLCFAGFRVYMTDIRPLFYRLQRCFYARIPTLSLCHLK